MGKTYTHKFTMILQYDYCEAVCVPFCNKSSRREDLHMRIIYVSKRLYNIKKNTFPGVNAYRCNFPLYLYIVTTVCWSALNLLISTYGLQLQGKHRTSWTEQICHLEHFNLKGRILSYRLDPQILLQDTMIQHMHRKESL